MKTDEIRRKLHYAYAHKNLSLSLFKQLLKKFVFSIICDTKERNPYLDIMKISKNEKKTKTKK